MVFLDHDFQISPPDPKCAGGQYNSGIDTAVFLLRNPDHRYDSRHITKPPPLTEMGGNNAAVFTLGQLASYKALYELIVTPFYWDKTEQGLSNET
jgi:hypothetical protein